MNKSGFRKRRTPQNALIGFALILSPSVLSVLSVSSVVNSAGFRFKRNAVFDKRKKQPQHSPDLLQ